MDATAHVASHNLFNSTLSSAKLLSGGGKQIRVPIVEAESTLPVKSVDINQKHASQDSDACSLAGPSDSPPSPKTRQVCEEDKLDMRLPDSARENGKDNC